MEELTENAEDGADEAESKQSEVKLGRLQYKVSSLVNLHEFAVPYTNTKWKYLVREYIAEAREGEDAILFTRQAKELAS